MYIRNELIDNTFILSLLGLIFSLSESVFLYDIIISILGNAISILNDKEQGKAKPTFTVKKIIKMLAAK